VEGADEVLPRRDVDRRLAADGSVHLPDERRRHGHPRHAAHVRRGGEPGDVGRGATPQPDDGGRAVASQLSPELLEHGAVLGRLTLRHLVRCQ
jgi:hypothetical protein